MQERGQNGQDQPDYGQPPQFSNQIPPTGQQPQWGNQQPQWTQPPGQSPQLADQPPQQPTFPGYQPPPAAKKNTGLKIAGFGCLGVVALVVIVVIAAVAVGSKNTTNVNTTAANTAAAKNAAGAAPATSAKKAAGLGDTVDVTDVSGDKLAVTLKKVDAGAKATDGFSSPDSGNQYYAAQFEIKNVGSSAWSDAPSNCTVVKDGKGQTFESTILESISSGPMMPDTANLAAGDSTLGWIVFEVPKGDKVTTVQFTPLSGMDDDTAQWSL
jgi:hypothetical protein